MLHTLAHGLGMGGLVRAAQAIRCGQSKVVAKILPSTSSVGSLHLSGTTNNPRCLILAPASASYPPVSVASASGGSFIVDLWLTVGLDAPAELVLAVGLSGPSLRAVGRLPLPPGPPRRVRMSYHVDIPAGGLVAPFVSSSTGGQVKIYGGRLTVYGRGVYGNSAP